MCYFPRRLSARLLSLPSRPTTPSSSNSATLNHQPCSQLLHTLFDLFESKDTIAAHAAANSTEAIDSLAERLYYRDKGHRSNGKKLVDIPELTRSRNTVLVRAFHGAAEQTVLQVRVIMSGHSHIG